MTISVIIATRNRSRSLAKTVNALFQQKVLANEIIIMSASDTPQQLINEKQYLTGKFKQAGVQCFHTKHVNKAYSLNKALKKINPKTNIIAFLDDDCLPSKYWIEKIRSLHINNPKTICIGGTYITPNPGFLTQIFYKNLDQALNSKSQFQYLFGGNFSVKAKEMKKRNLLFNDKLNISEDYDFVQNLIQQKIPVFTTDNNELKVVHSSHDNSIRLIMRQFLYGYGEFFINYKYLNEEYFNYFSTKTPSLSDFLHHVPRDYYNIVREFKKSPKQIPQLLGELILQTAKISGLLYGLFKNQKVALT